MGVTGFRTFALPFPPAAAGADAPCARPPRWLLAVALVVTVAVTADLLGGGVLERGDLRVSEVVSAWDLKDSAAYWPVWAGTQLGGGGFILILLGRMVGYLGWRVPPPAPPGRGGLA